MDELLTPEQIEGAIAVNKTYLNKYQCPYSKCDKKPIYWCCLEKRINAARIAIACEKHAKEIAYEIIRELTIQEIFVMRTFL